MKKTSSVKISTMVLGLLLAISASAKPKEETQHLTPAETSEAFTAQAAAIRAEMNAGGRYEFITESEQKTVETRLDEISHALTQYGSTNAFPPAEQVAVLNAQEEINAILTRRDSQRLICERRAPVGSHLQKTECETYGAREAAKRNSEKYFMDSQMKTFTPSKN